MSEYSYVPVETHPRQTDVPPRPQHIPEVEIGSEDSEAPADTDSHYANTDYGSMFGGGKGVDTSDIGGDADAVAALEAAELAKEPAVEAEPIPAAEPQGRYRVIETETEPAVTTDASAPRAPEPVVEPVEPVVEAGVESGDTAAPSANGRAHAIGSAAVDVATPDHPAAANGRSSNGAKGYVPVVQQPAAADTPPRAPNAPAYEVTAPPAASSEHDTVVPAAAPAPVGEAFTPADSAAPGATVDLTGEIPEMGKPPAEQAADVNAGSTIDDAGAAVAEPEAHTSTDVASESNGAPAAESTEQVIVEDAPADVAVVEDVATDVVEVGDGVADEAADAAAELAVDTAATADDVQLTEDIPEGQAAPTDTAVPAEASDAPSDEAPETTDTTDAAAESPMEPIADATPGVADSKHEGPYTPRHAAGANESDGGPASTTSPTTSPNVAAATGTDPNAPLPPPRAPEDLYAGLRPAPDWGGETARPADGAYGEYRGYAGQEFGPAPQPVQPAAVTATGRPVPTGSTTLPGVGTLDPRTTTEKVMDGFVDAAKAAVLLPGAAVASVVGSVFGHIPKNGVQDDGGGRYTVQVTIANKTQTIKVISIHPRVARWQARIAAMWHRIV